MFQPMGKNKPLDYHITVFQAKVYALLICAKLEGLLHKYNCSIAICSDSLAGIKAVSAHKATCGLVADAMSALKTLAIYNSLRLIWVPGHCEIAKNEKADAFAKQASASYFTGPEPYVGISVSNIYSSINEWTVHEQNRMWQAPSGCRQAKYFLHGAQRIYVCCCRAKSDLWKQDVNTYK